MDLSSIETPRICIDHGRVRANIASMQARANAAHVRLRPHAKTHKSPLIARWQIDAGAVGVCCAKLGEAEVFVAAGINDIRLPYPIQPTNAERLKALQDRARISIIVDDEQVASAWAQTMRTAGRTLDVLVKVDVGTHRCGVDPDAPGTVDVIHRIATMRGLRFLGLLSHAGHSYGAKSPADIEAIAIHERALLTTIAGKLNRAGVDIPEISVGSTPSARFIDRQPGITEMRPGTYVFHDRTQVGLGAASLEECAMSIVSTVVSRPAATRVVFDAGSKTLSQDGVRGFNGEVGHGLVFRSLDATLPDPSITVDKLSEEHAVARVPADCPLRPGDRVRIIPNHTCVVTNLANELLLTDGMQILEVIPVAARGKIW